MKIPTLLILSACAAFSASHSSSAWAASVHQDWVRRSEGTALAVATDAPGSVFVTGVSHDAIGHLRFYTAKYAGPAGTLLWERSYDGPSGGDDTARALVVDAGGNVIVTGSSAGAGGKADFYTAKYRGSDGKIVWENRYNGLANGADEAYAMAIDAAGAILVTGTSTGPGGSQDLCTVKYAGGDGALLWQTRLSRFGAASPAAIAVDAADNVIVTGTAGNFAYTAKYARASGALLWQRLSGGPAGTAKYNKAVATDPAGNVIVTGSSYVIDDPYQFTPLLTVKYAATTGATLWERSEQDTYGGSGVATNAAGDVFVTGGKIFKEADPMSNNAVKYAGANGALLWKKNLGFKAPAVVVDVQGNATFGGQFHEQEGPLVYDSFRVTRLTGTDGALLWTQTYDIGGESVDGRKPLALTPDGGAVLVGHSGGDFTTVKYAPLPSTPLTSVAAASGNAAPGAGSPGGLPAGARYASFGIPAINDEGLVAFVANTSSDTILVAGDAVLARVGQPAPGIAGAKFTALGDPVIGASGRVAFIGQVSGGGSNATNNAGIWIADAHGGLFLFVRTGDFPLGEGGPRFESFRSISISNDDVLYVAKFVDGPGGATAANDLGVWRGFYEPLLRTGSQIPVGGGTKALLSFKALDVVAGSPGQGRNYQDGIFSAALAFTDGTSAIAAPAVGNLRTGQSVNLATTGGTITGARWKSFGIPSSDTGPAPIPTSVAFTGALETGFGGVTATRSTGLFVAPLYGVGAVVIARTADPVLGLPGVTFASFLDPVANIVPGQEMAVAAVATLAGSGVSAANDTALIVGGSAAPGAEVLARQGDAAPGAAGTQWGNFPFIVQPEWTNAGPLFVAQLQGNATPANNVGLWSADWSGNLSLLLRRGSLVTVGAVSKKVADFTVLSAVPGSPGVARSYNAEHHVIVRAVFTDSTQALLRITAP